MFEDLREKVDIAFNRTQEELKRSSTSPSSLLHRLRFPKSGISRQRKYSTRTLACWDVNCWTAPVPLTVQTSQISQSMSWRCWVCWVGVRSTDKWQTVISSSPPIQGGDWWWYFHSDADAILTDSGHLRSDHAVQLWWHMPQWCPVFFHTRVQQWPSYQQLGLVYPLPVPVQRVGQVPPLSCWGTGVCTESKSMSSPPTPVAPWYTAQQSTSQWSCESLLEYKRTSASDVHAYTVLSWAQQSGGSPDQLEPSLGRGDTLSRSTQDSWSRVATLSLQPVATCSRSWQQLPWGVPWLWSFLDATNANA